MATDADRQLQTALRVLLAGDISELIADARRDAQRRVRARLTDEITEALLAGAHEAICEPAQRKPAQREPAQRDPAPERPSEETTGFYVYCVVSADTQVPTLADAIDPALPPKVIREGRLAAVVSEVALEDFGEQRLRERLADMEWLERAARTHEAVLDAVARNATLIPLRLCSVYRDLSGVLEMLEREAPALERALEYLCGKSEWAVKVFARPRATRHHAHADGDSGTDYMHKRKDDRDRRRGADQELHAACVAIHERLSEVVAAATTSAPQRPELSGHPGPMLLNGVYLVEDDQLQPFLDTVDLLQAEHDADGLELVSTGPWPAYNFVPGTIGAAW